MSNRVFVGVPMYGPIFPRFYQNYMGSISQVAREVRDAGFTEPVPMLSTTMPYIDHADTGIVQNALQNPNWDYLCLVEQDNIVPPDWYHAVVHEFDPAVHHVVGRWYFGKAQEDQRSICGYLRPNGNFDRLSYEQVQYFRKNRGLYRVGAGMEGVDDTAETFVVGMGCTAIHRSVLENWSGEMPWFRSVSSWDAATGKLGYLGQDVNFCMEAAKQGYHVWLDTRPASGHIGEFVSDDETYTASAKYAESKGMANLATSESVPTTGIPTAMSRPELDRLGELAGGKTVLEIGSRYGASAMSMAGNGAEIVYALDWHRGDVWHEASGVSGDTLTQFWLNVGFYRLKDKIVPLVGTSAQVLPLLPDQHFDFIFVDGDHSYEGSKFDFEQALRLLKPGGLIAIHDYERELAPQHRDRADLEIGVARAADELFGAPDEIVDTLAVYRDPARKTIAA